MVDGPRTSESEQEFTDRFRLAFVSRWGESRASDAATTIERFARAAWSVDRHVFSPSEFPAFYLHGPERDTDGEPS